MCKIMEEIRDEGRAEGADEAQVGSIRNLMETLHLTMQQAMDALRIPEEKRDAYSSMLTGQPAA